MAVFYKKKENINVSDGCTVMFSNLMLITLALDEFKKNTFVKLSYAFVFSFFNTFTELLNSCITFYFIACSKSLFYSCILMH